MEVSNAHRQPFQLYNIIINYDKKNKMQTMEGGNSIIVLILFGINQQEIRTIGAKKCKCRAIRLQNRLCSVRVGIHLLFDDTGENGLFETTKTNYTISLKRCSTIQQLLQYNAAIDS